MKNYEDFNLDLKSSKADVSRPKATTTPACSAVVSATVSSLITGCTPQCTDYCSKKCSKAKGCTRTCNCNMTKISICG